jgi:type VI secretion system protein ImpJ
MFLKPLWTEGLFVSQHHFQAQDQYVEDLVRQRMRLARRFDWGLLDVEIDDRSLRAGQFGFRRFAAVWPDGVVVKCGGAGEDPCPDARSFGHAFASDAAKLPVFVGLLNESASSANVAPPGEAEAPRRFARARKCVADFNTGGALQEIEFARPCLRILFGTEKLDGYSVLPVAELMRQTNGEVILRDNFVPPVLRVPAAPFVVQGLSRVLGAMTTRQRELGAARKQRHAGSVEFHFTDAQRFWLLHTLNAAIPVFAHLLDTGEARPEEVYLALVGLLGQLCTFAPDDDPTLLPRFNYADLGDVFETLFARVVSLLSIDAVPAYAEVALERRNDGMFVGRISDPRLVNREFFLAVRSNLPEPSVRERIPQLLKVAAWNHIYDVVKQARHGVRAEVEWNPSSSLPIKPGLCFFRLRREGPFWEEIAKTRTVALYVPSDAEWKDTTLSVFAVDPEYLR